MNFNLLLLVIIKQGFFQKDTKPYLINPSISNRTPKKQEAEKESIKNKLTEDVAKLPNN